MRDKTEIIQLKLVININNHGSVSLTDSGHAPSVLTGVSKEPMLPHILQ